MFVRSGVTAHGQPGLLRDNQLLCVKGDTGSTRKTTTKNGKTKQKIKY